MNVKFIMKTIENAGYKAVRRTTEAGPEVGIMFEKILGNGQSQFDVISGLVPIDDAHDEDFALSLIEKADKFREKNNLGFKIIN